MGDDATSAVGARRHLPVRSAVLSVLLGCYPEVIPSRQLVAAARHFDITESAVRVALTRAVAKGELERVSDGYRIGERLLRRQQRQSESIAASSEAWDGSWETAIVVASARSASDRLALRSLLHEHRLAELREGVWLRPANLARAPSYESHADLIVCRSDRLDSAGVAQRLWDLLGWSRTGTTLIEELGDAKEPAPRLAVAAALVRHLSSDPILPSTLLPSGWPGQEMRSVYAAYQRELLELALQA